MFPKERLKKLKYKIYITKITSDPPVGMSKVLQQGIEDSLCKDCSCMVSMEKKYKKQRNISVNIVSCILKFCFNVLKLFQSV
jgi:hypothetical protein